jgi:transcriptional regulator with GAF, ATPase, and Fis domain
MKSVKNTSSLQVLKRSQLEDFDPVILGGAATRLGMNRSTLQFRMKKLGIVRSMKAFEV